MMTCYRDIHLFDELEISLGFLWIKLYTQIHLALVAIKDDNDRVDVGVSFPKYGDKLFSLGDRLRLFAPNRERLETFNLERYLDRLSDYLELSPIRQVPTDVAEFAIFRRVHFKSDAQVRRLAKRRAEREGVAYEKVLIDYQETMKKYEKLKSQNALPYLNIQSLSNGNRMKLFIEKIASKEAKDGDFSTYGLSDNATVPMF